MDKKMDKRVASDPQAKQHPIRGCKGPQSKSSHFATRSRANPAQVSREEIITMLHAQGCFNATRFDQQ